MKDEAVEMLSERLCSAAEDAVVPKDCGDRNTVPQTGPGGALGILRAAEPARPIKENSG